MTKLKSRRWTRSALVLMSAAAVAACGTEPEETDEQLIADAALIAADATLEDVRLWGSTIASGGPATTASGPQAMPGDPGGHHGFFGSFSGSRSVTFYDENGEVQDEYDALLTDSIVIEHEIEGEVSREGWSASVYRERMKTVSGLLGEETTRTWNGTGTSEVSRSRHLDDGTERGYEATSAVEYDDVVVPIPGSDPRWPLSGTVTREMTITRTGEDGEVTRSVTVVVTFNGTSTATAVVNGEEIEIDLTARDGRNPVRFIHRQG